MKTFNDNAGRTWAVAINLECVKRLKSLLGINLLDAIEGKLLEQLVSDPVLLCDCVYAICKPEAELRGCVLLAKLHQFFVVGPPQDGKGHKGHEPQQITHG